MKQNPNVLFWGNVFAIVASSQPMCCFNCMQLLGMQGLPLWLNTCRANPPVL